MSGETTQFLYIFGFFSLALFICGLYCILVTRNMIRAIIGLELFMKSATLLLIVVGYATNKTGLIQALVITVIVLEVIVAAIAGGFALRVFKYNDSLDVRKLRNLKG